MAGPPTPSGVPGVAIDVGLAGPFGVHPSAAEGKKKDNENDGGCADQKRYRQPPAFPPPRIAHHVACRGHHDGGIPHVFQGKHFRGPGNGCD